MAVFNSSVLTARGNELLVDAVAGDKIIFTRMVVGCGEYLEEEKERRFLEKATSLKDVRQEFTFSTHKKVSEQCVLLTAVISNKGLDYSYKITEIGVYGKRDGEEEDYLCSIAVTKSLEESDTFPPYNGLQECQIVQDYYITISPDAEVSVNTRGACVLREEFDEIKVILDKLGTGAFADVINNLIATEEGGVLDARQGKILKDMIDRIEQSFQDGCKMITDRLTALGYAPASPQGPAQIVDAINVMYNDRYDKGYEDGREQGHADVIADPGAYGIDTGIKYNSSVATSNIDGFSLSIYKNESNSHSEEMNQTMDRNVELRVGDRMLYALDMTQKIQAIASYEGRVSGSSEWVLKTVEGTVIQSGSTGSFANGYDDHGNAEGGTNVTNKINIDLFMTPFTTAYSYVVLSMHTVLRGSCGVSGAANGNVTYSPITAKYKG